jgi:hypothetical protein
MLNFGPKNQEGEEKKPAKKVLEGAAAGQKESDEDYYARKVGPKMISLSYVSGSMGFPPSNQSYSLL